MHEDPTADRRLRNYGRGGYRTLTASTPQYKRGKETQLELKRLNNMPERKLLPLVETFYSNKYFFNNKYTLIIRKSIRVHDIKRNQATIVKISRYK